MVIPEKALAGEIDRYGRHGDEGPPDGEAVVPPLMLIGAVALVPKEAPVRRDGRETVCSVKTNGIDETVIVRPGERMPVGRHGCHRVVARRPGLGARESVLPCTRSLAGTCLDAAEVRVLRPPLRPSPLPVALETHLGLPGSRSGSPKSRTGLPGSRPGLPGSRPGLPGSRTGPR